RELAEDRLTFAQILDRLGASLSQADFALIGEVTTAAFAPIRFATTFFVAHLPLGQQPEVWHGELETGYWASAADALRRWTCGELLLSPPPVMTLEAIRDRPADEAPERLGPLLQSLASGAIHPIYFSPGVQMIPLHTLALPPSTHTNAYLVGPGPCYLL